MDSNLESVGLYDGIKKVQTFPIVAQKVAKVVHFFNIASKSQQLFPLLLK